jgi:hypothetical protein
MQRDFLLSLAAEGMYRPVWSAAILAELENHETEKLVCRGEQEDKAAGRAQYLVQQMRPTSKIPNGIAAISPVEFAANTVELDPLRASTQSQPSPDGPVKKDRRSP